MPSSFFDQVMKTEREALAREQRLYQAPSFTAVCDIAEVRDSPGSLRSKHPVQIESLGNLSFVQVCPSLGYRFLWTHVENNAYRADYQQHLARVYGAAAMPLTEDLHVDHMCNRARARKFKLNYIRMALLPGSVNVSHGAGYEKNRTQGGGREFRPRHVDTINWMKLLGFRSPATIGGRPTPEIIAFAALLAPMIGADVAELQREVSDLLDYARSRPDQT